MISLGVVSIEGLAWLFIKASLVVVIVTYLAEQFRHSPAAVRHRFWVGLLVAMAAIPVWSLLAPEFLLPIVPPDSRLSESTWMQLLATIYLLVVFARTTGLLASIARVAWISFDSVDAGQQWQQSLDRLHPGRKVLLRASERVESPITWGFLRPVIVVPAYLQASLRERRMILKHELEHVRRGDWLTQLLGRLIAILFWPVPGLRHALSRLSLEAEQSCDDRVLASEADAPAYAALLLRQAQAQHIPTSVALGQPSELALRIKNLCESALDHRAPKGLFWSVPLSLVLALPIASLQLSERPADDPRPPREMGMRLGKFRMSPPSGANASISKPDRPLEVSRPPQLNYVLAPAEMDVAVPEMGLPSRIVDEALGIEGAALGKWEPGPIATPGYPERARRRGIEGDVTVLYDLTEAGKIVNLRILSARPRGIFEDSIYEALSVAGDDDSKIAIRDLESVYRFRLKNSQARASPH